MAQLPAPEYWDQQAEEVSRTSLTSIRSSATAWAGTTSALLGIFGTAAIVKGPDTLGKLSSVWNWFVFVLIVFGLLLAVYGIIQTALAAQGSGPVTFTPLTGRRLARWNRDEGRRAAQRLVWGRQAIVAAAIVLSTTGFIAMLDGLTAKANETFAVARTNDGSIQCGTLTRAPNGGLELTFGEDGGETFPLDQAIADVTVVDDCPLAP